jgi:5-methylcytosine-specific restriction endonuclease McrA
LGAWRVGGCGDGRRMGRVRTPTVEPMSLTGSSESRFYGSKAWKTMRLRILERDNWICQICHQPTVPGSPRAGDRPCVDHIIELRVRPELALEPGNLRCSHGKCNLSRRKKPKGVSWQPATPW